MKRRSFLKKGAVAAAASLSIPALSLGAQRGARGAEFARTSTDVEATIMVKGLPGPYTVLQVSDSHISHDGEADEKYKTYSSRMGKAYPTVIHPKTKERVAPLAGFAAMMEMAKESEVDFIALTGDIVNYPSTTAVEAVRKAVEATGIPYNYTAGNHDWHYEGMAGSADELRAEWSEKGLKPLYNGGNPLYGSSLANGLNLVTIDNSTYQVNQEQLDFYRRQLSRPEPIVLFMHIPIYMPTLGAGSCGHPQWGAAVDRGYEVERRERWPESGNSPTTVAFVKEVMATKRLTGIFVGHYHRSTAMSFNGIHQYISGSAFNGQYRLIRFLPL